MREKIKEKHYADERLFLHSLMWDRKYLFYFVKGD
jgi:hypothetical protein